MQSIRNITADPNQQFKFQLPDGSVAYVDIRYVQNQSGWFYDFRYKDFIATNRRMVDTPNMLRQFRRIIPQIGIAIYTTDGDLMYEPIFLDDFLSGRAVLNILDAADVIYVEQVILKRVA